MWASGDTIGHWDVHPGQFGCCRFGGGSTCGSARSRRSSRLREPAVANMMVVSRSAMMPETALAAVMQAWVPRLPAWRAAKHVRHLREREKSSWVWWRLKWHPYSMSNKRRTTAHLLGDFASAVDELFLGVGVVWTALQCSCFLLTRPVQLLPRSATCFLMWEPIWTKTIKETA